MIPETAWTGYDYALRISGLNWLHKKCSGKESQGRIFQTNLQKEEQGLLARCDHQNPTKKLEVNVLSHFYWNFTHPTTKFDSFAVYSAT